MEWLKIVDKIKQSKDRLDKSYKCINQDRPISRETLNKHLEVLVNSLENIRVILNVNYSRLTNQHKDKAHEIFNDCRDK